MIKTERLGSTDLLVTSIGAGCAPLGGLPQDFGHIVDEEQGIAIVKLIFSSRINFLDTASAYERSEDRIGRAILEVGGLPEGIIIATKADRDLLTGNADADQIKRSVEDSLNRLGLSYLPLVYLHDPEYFTQSFEEVMSKEGAVSVLLNLKEQGVIGNIGISGGPIEMMKRFISMEVFDVVITHNRYTLLNRTAQSLINLASEKGIGVVNAAIFGGGVLIRGFQENSRYAYRAIPPSMAERIRGIENICREFKVSLGAVALQFSLRNPRIHSTVVGFEKPSEVDEVLSLAEYKIPDVIWPEIDKFAIYDQDPEE